jgi:hypothetical protein
VEVLVDHWINQVQLSSRKPMTKRDDWFIKPDRIIRVTSWWCVKTEICSRREHISTRSGRTKKNYSYNVVVANIKVHGNWRCTHELLENHHRWLQNYCWSGQTYKNPSICILRTIISSSLLFLKGYNTLVVVILSSTTCTLDIVGQHRLSKHRPCVHR